MKRQNITLDPEVFEEFCKYAGKKGINISTWVNLKMKEFIEEKKAKDSKVTVNDKLDYIIELLEKSQK